MVSLALESGGIILNYLKTGDTSIMISPSSQWLVSREPFFGFASSTFRSALAGLTPVDLTALGVMVLLLTPYARIVAAVVYYAVERDWKYVSITLFVFAVVTCGLVLL
jgi:uncharacterized membrane protein